MKYFFQRHRWNLLGLTVLFIVSTLPFLSKTPFNWDAAQFVLGVEHFSVNMHQPHPPGYPLYVGLGKVLALITSSHTALLIITVLIAAVTILVLYILVLRIWSQRWLATVVAGAFMLNPLFWLYREVSLTYVVDTFTGTLLALLTYNVITHLPDGSYRKFLYASSVFLALGAGFRPSMFFMLLPLLVVQWTYVWLKTKQWKPILVAAIVVGVGVLIWFIPLVTISGGLKEYRIDSSRQFRDAAATTSVFYGATWKDTGTQVMFIIETIFASLNTLMIPVIGALAWLIYRLIVKKWHQKWSLFWIIFGWTVVPVIIYTLLHFAQIGYALIFLPLFYLVLAAILNFVNLISNRILRQISFFLMAICIAINAGVFLLFTPTFGHPDFIPTRRIDFILQTMARKSDVLFKMNATIIQKRDDSITDFNEVITAYSPDEILVVASRNIFYPAKINQLPVRNDEIFRELSATLPDYYVFEIAPDRDYYLEAHNNEMELIYDTTITVPDSVKYVLFAVNWLTDSDKPTGILISREGEHYIGIMQKPFTYKGFTVQQEKDIK
ncbi:MAG: DUF2723 domain-containing protein [bacterium]|nr:DUF2723 domain-containing protein [bacterium]